MDIEQVKKGHKRLLTKGGTQRELAEAHTDVSVNAVIEELKMWKDWSQDGIEMALEARIAQIKQLKDNG